MSEFDCSKCGDVSYLKEGCEPYEVEGENVCDDCHLQHKENQIIALTAENAVLREKLISAIDYIHGCHGEDCPCAGLDEQEREEVVCDCGTAEFIKNLEVKNES